MIRDEGGLVDADGLHEAEAGWQWYRYVGGYCKYVGAAKAKEARKEQIEDIRRMQVDNEMPRQVCLEETRKAPLGTRWVDADQGTGVVRCRLVEPVLSFPLSVLYVASFPGALHHKPPEGRRSLWPWTSTRLTSTLRRRDESSVELPPEDAASGVLVLLARSLYGTRDAAYLWS